MQMKGIKLGVLTAASLTVFMSVGSLAMAHDGTDDTIRSTIQTSSNQQAASPRIAGRQTACRVHERVINSTMQHIATRGQRHLEVFDKIAVRVESFASTKGTKPANYDALVADVNAKRTAALAVVDKVKSDSVSFKCDGSDPKGIASGFKADLKAEITALKAYKTAVKNLIVGVKSANHTTANTSGGSEQ